CDPPETCPKSCPPRGCAHFMLEGSPEKCTAHCVELPSQTACVNNDGCCPPAPSTCNAINDNDCTVTCGNKVKEGNETCDPLSSRPSDGQDISCQIRRLINASTCTAECIDDHKQTRCMSGNGCCPPNCDNNHDAECPVVCGNKAVESGEECDPVSDCMNKK